MHYRITEYRHFQIFLTCAFMTFLAFLLAAVLIIFLNSLAMSSLVMMAPGGPRGPAGPLCNGNQSKVTWAPTKCVAKISECDCIFPLVFFTLFVVILGPNGCAIIL